MPGFACPRAFLDLTDEEADRAHVPSTNLGRRVLVRGYDLVHGGFQRTGVRDLTEALGLCHHGGVVPGFEHPL